MKIVCTSYPNRNILLIEFSDHVSYLGSKVQSRTCCRANNDLLKIRKKLINMKEKKIRTR